MIYDLYPPGTLLYMRLITNEQIICKLLPSDIAKSSFIKVGLPISYGYSEARRSAWYITYSNNISVYSEDPEHSAYINENTIVIVDELAEQYKHLYHTYSQKILDQLAEAQQEREQEQAASEFAERLKDIIDNTPPDGEVH